MTFALLQLTDPHLGAEWSEDPAAALERAIDAAKGLLNDTPTAVVVSGDVANGAADSEYAQARALLDRLGCPVYVIPGNHDRLDGLRRQFEMPHTSADVPQTDADPLYYAVDFGPARLIALDTTHPGRAGGRLDPAQLTWLDRVLGEEITKPTLVAMHHPPLITGIPAMDAIGIAEDDRLGFAAVISRHTQVHVIATGHVHRAIVGQLGGAAVFVIPSTDLQLALDLTSDEVRFVREPPCFALHLLVAGRIVSHLQPIGTWPS